MTERLAAIRGDESAKFLTSHNDTKCPVYPA